VPEGDIVWRAARALDRALAGRVVVDSRFAVPHLAVADLRGQTVLGCGSRGKHLLLRFDGGLTLHSHLRMEGAWRLVPAGSRRRPGPPADVRVVVRTDEWTAVGLRLGVLDLVPTVDEDRVIGHLGPDLLDPGFDPSEALRRLRAQGGRPIGETLLDQRVVAGLGNLFRTELCFVRGVTPWTPTLDVPDLPRVITLARQMLQLSARTGEQVTTGRRARDQQHWVFQRETCLRCGTRLLEAMQGPRQQERVTVWCPSCQRGPAPDDATPVRVRRGPPSRTSRPAR
jgi:endonuclease-8